MASLISVAKYISGPKHFKLYKKITTLGSNHDNDICIQHPDVSDNHAYIVNDGKNFVIHIANKKSLLLVNGEKVRTHTLAHEDTITLGKVPLVFDLYDKLGDREEQQQFNEVEYYQKLYTFTENISGKYDIEELLNILIDSIIDVTGAANGFLILHRNRDDYDFTVARNVNRQTIANADMYVSDSIIRRVLETGKPIIVSDALSDEEFKTSASVLSLKLTSVMCVPIKEAGELLGIIYVGNNNIVNLFSHDTLLVLEIFASQAALVIKNALLVNELQQDKAKLEEQLDAMRMGSIIGSCDSIKEVFRKIEKIAKVDVPVLVTGETGTGKELVAKEIHNKSPRSSGPFVVINCGAIPETLLESELFGHKRGAFTGAMYDKPGKFKLANGGTLFLDEIGDMPLSLQVKILRAIEERSVVPVGGNRTEDVDIRIIAATNRDLEDDIREGKFREDLFYRLNVIHIGLPPLRDRESDIELIARYFLQKQTIEYKRPHIKGFSPAAKKMMEQYRWPGNVRELMNRIKKAVILCEQSLIDPEDLELSEKRKEELAIRPLAQAREEWQKNYILQALKKNQGNRTRTAQMLDVDPRTIFRYLEKIDDTEKP